MKYQKDKFIVSALLVLMTLSIFGAHVQAQTPQQTLTQYIADLQKNPNDNALREKIIRHVQTMKQKPAVPEEARKYVNRGIAAAEGAKTENDYKDAIAEFQKAVDIAPWLGVGYRGLAVTQDKAGQYTQALQNLKLFLLTNPSPTDVEAANTLRDKIEYRQEKAAKESSPAALAEKKQTAYEAWLKKIDGARFVFHASNEDDMTIDIHGNKVVYGSICLSNCENKRFPRGWRKFEEVTLTGREFVILKSGYCFPDGIRALNGKISEDGYSLTLEGCGGTNTTYRRER